MNADGLERFHGKVVQASRNAFGTKPVVLVAVLAENTLPPIAGTGRQMNADNGPGSPFVVPALDQLGIISGCQLLSPFLGRLALHADLAARTAVWPIDSDFTARYCLFQGVIFF